MMPGKAPHMSGGGVGPRISTWFGTSLARAGVVMSVCPVASCGVALDAGLCALAAGAVPSCADRCPNEAHSASTHASVLMLKTLEKRTLSAAGVLRCKRTCDDQLVAIPNRIACVLSEAD